jgi:1-acyl-sn-glycerol-3-phosphate acyltransferase
MKRWSKGYEALRTYVRFAFWLTHKRIVVVGRDLIPKEVPIIFAANHQNALMDPLAISCTNPLQTLWLARADIFKSKLARPALKFMKMVPIYRIRDGKDNLTNNELIFNQVTEVLKNKDSVALFPEAAHSGKRQMLQHKKAIPRIALEAEDKNNFQLGLQIVPVGIYYNHYWKFNRTLVVQYGSPIGIGQYKKRYADNPQNAMISLRDEIHEKLEPLTLQINSKELYQDYEDIRMVAGEEFAHYKFFSKNPILQQLWADQELIAKLEKMQEDQYESFDQKDIDLCERTKKRGIKQWKSCQCQSHFIFQNFVSSCLCDTYFSGFNLWHSL